MSLRRHTVLIASMLALWASEAQSADQGGSQAPAAATLPAANSIANISVRPQEEGRWQVDFDYVFAGDQPDAVFHIDLTVQPRPEANTSYVFHGPAIRRAEPGAHHFSTSFDYPSEATSTQFIVSLTTGGFGPTPASTDVKVLASERIDQVVKWPSGETRQYYLARDLLNSGTDENLHRARPILEQLIAKNPQFDPAFLELARIAMRTNWGPEGLHQAETLINSALAIRPDSADAKILLGYVYANQHRFREAEELFEAAARVDPPNNWLWTNWGDLLEMQGRNVEAIAKYREALKRPENLASFNARFQAYNNLLALLKARKDFDGMEALYKQRVSEFGAGSCFSAEYARFKLNVRGDPQGAIDLARGALNLDCEDAPSREILGLASYVKWAGGTGTESTQALNQARIYLPPGPHALYLLTSDESTMSAAKRLLSSGENIDQKDNGRMTALALALQRGALESAERLLRLGARPDTLVGEEDMPVALLPVLDSNLDAIRILQRAGVDYSKLRYHGHTALDFARQSGNDALLKALTRSERAL